MKFVAKTWGQGSSTVITIPFSIAAMLDDNKEYLFEIKEYKKGMKV